MEVILVICVTFLMLLGGVSIMLRFPLKANDNAVKEFGSYGIIFMDVCFPVILGGQFTGYPLLWNRNVTCHKSTGKLIQIF
jgi:hypothetical protein